MPGEVVNITVGRHSLSVLTHGAHILSWRVDGVEQLFVSSQAVFAAGKAIRGGIPICWPQFGPNGPIQMHGFARNIIWQHVSTSSSSVNASSTSTAVFELHATDATRAMWPNEFTLSYTITLDSTGRLGTSLAARNDNTNGKLFDFTAALHSYFAVADIRRVGVVGLKGTEYIDKMKEAQRFREENERLTITRETDRVYCGAGDVKLLTGETGMLITKPLGLPDSVVWNPWIDKAKALADLHDDEWQKFCCVESGAIERPITLLPGAAWVGTQLLDPLVSPSKM